VHVTFLLELTLSTGDGYAAVTARKKKGGVRKKLLSLSTGDGYAAVTAVQGSVKLPVRCKRAEPGDTARE
jgi:hypothetical protein